MIITKQKFIKVNLILVYIQYQKFQLTILIKIQNYCLIETSTLICSLIYVD